MKSKQDKAIVDLINQMFIIAGHEVTFDDIIGVEDWFRKYTMTQEQSDEFKEWGKQYLKKTLRMTDKAAEKEMLWFVLRWGLTFKTEMK